VAILAPPLSAPVLGGGIFVNKKRLLDHFSKLDVR